MFDEKNVYIRQAEVKGSFKQSASGTFLLGELTVNSSLKNYKKVLKGAFDITMDELKTRNSVYDSVKEKKVISKTSSEKEKNKDVRM